VASMRRLKRQYSQDLRYVRRYRNVKDSAGAESLALDGRFQRWLDRYGRAIDHSYRVLPVSARERNA